MLEAERTQGLVWSGFGRLPRAAFVRLTITDRADAVRSLRRLWEEEVTFGDQRPPAEATQVALTAPGLAALGGAPGLLDGAFAQGIVAPQRSRALGDAGRNDPSGWAWSDTTVHATLLVYGLDEQPVEARVRTISAALSGWRSIGHLPIRVATEEPFGFRDGLTNPRIGRAGDGLAPGAVVVGQPDSDGLVHEHSSLAVDGSYLVIRQLDQDVAGFWRSFEAAAGGDRERARWLAAKAVGRWPNGMPLAAGEPGPQPAFDPEVAQRPLTHADDRLGDACPIGAHTRRADPRDGLVDDPLESAAITARHRLLRRGRMYGPGTGTGLLFMCLCANVARQFELVQHAWINNPKHGRCFGEVDPVAAGAEVADDRRRFSIPRDPIRLRLRNVGGSVTVRGGGYFFLPGRAAFSEFLRSVE